MLINSAFSHSFSNTPCVMDEPRLVKFDWSVQYAECDLAPKHLESKPVLTLYLGAQFVRAPETGGVVNIPLDEDHLAKEYKGTLVGTLRRDQGSVIPIRAPIGIASAALHRNDTGTPCYVDVGSSIALIGDVLAEIKQRGYYEHAHELLMRNSMLQGDEHIRKGVIKLRISACQVGTAIKMPAPGQLPAVGSQSLVLERIAATQAREDTVAAYVQATMQHEMGFPDSLPNIGRVRVPMDISETGALLTGHSYLPIAAYAMVETPVANADFFVNAFERVMARTNLAVAAYNAMDTRGKAQVMGRILGYGVQSMDYIGDSREPANRRNLVTDMPVKIANENMEQGWLRLAGDCEDFASALVATNHAWIGARFNAANPKHRPLMEMQAMLAEYIATPALSIVHGAKIGDEEGYGAHMYTPMFPRRKFMEALARTSDGRALLTRMKPVDRVPNTLVAAEAAAPKKGWNVDELPSMTLEGTGILSPLPTIEVVPQTANEALIGPSIGGTASTGGPTVGILDPIFAQRRKVAAGMPSLRGMKTEIPHFRYNNPFYMAITNVISDHFWKREGIPVAGFVVGQTAPAGSGAEMMRGIMYEDFLSNSPKLAIAPQPFIPQSVQSVIVEANSARPPIRAHVLDWTKPLAGKPQDPLLDRFVAGVAAFKRDAPQVPPPNSVDFIVKPHQYNAAKIGDWLKDAAAFNDLYHVSYELEHITNEVFTYRLRLWVK